jgi:hypothetical protein
MAEWDGEEGEKRRRETGEVGEPVSFDPSPLLKGSWILGPYPFAKRAFRMKLAAKRHPPSA